MTQKTPTKTLTMPDLGPIFAFWSKQAELALYMNDQMLKASMAPWHAMGFTKMPMGIGSSSLWTTTKARPAKAEDHKAATVAAPQTAPKAAAKPAPASPKPAPSAQVMPEPKADAEPHEMADPVPGHLEPASSAPAAKASTPPAAPVAQTASQADSAKAAPKAAAKPDTDAPAPAKAPTGTVTKAEPAAPETGGQSVSKPEGLSAPRGGVADSLRAIKGLGPKLEEALNAIGVYHYDQIAAWTAAEVAWIDENIGGVRGRASRDDWKSQAAALARGDAP